MNGLLVMEMWPPYSLFWSLNEDGSLQVLNLCILLDLVIHMSYRTHIFRLSDQGDAGVPKQRCARLLPLRDAPRLYGSAVMAAAAAAAARR